MKCSSSTVQTPDLSAAQDGRSEISRPVTMTALSFRAKSIEGSIIREISG